MKFDSHSVLCARCGGHLRSLMSSKLAGPQTVRGGSRLSRAERMVFLMLIEGLSNKEIAGRLLVSENTVKFHLKKLYSKLGVHSRAHAIAMGSGVVASEAALVQ